MFSQAMSNFQSEHKRFVFYCCTLWTGAHDAISWSETNMRLFHFNLLHRVHQFRECSNNRSNCSRLIDCVENWLCGDSIWSDEFFYINFTWKKLLIYIIYFNSQNYVCGRNNRQYITFSFWWISEPFRWNHHLKLAF